MNPTKIAYLTHTWNPLTGCNGPNGKRCDGCWAEEVAKTRLYPSAKQRLKDAPTQKDINRCIGVMEAYRTFTPTLHPERLDQPAKRKKSAVVGVCFMGDLFDPALNQLKLEKVLFGCVKAPQHTFVFLTKQPERMAYWVPHFFAPHDNWYLGFSARNQAEFDAGWPHMAKLAAAGWKVWVSLEPMQGPIDTLFCNKGTPCERFKKCSRCDHMGTRFDIFSGIILGAQSGKNAVTLNTDWARSVRDQCAAAGVPFMFKQDNSTGKVVVLPELDGVQHTATAWSI